MDKLTQEKSSIESSLYELKAKNYDWLDKNMVTKYILNFKQDLISDDDKLKRKAIETFVDKIKIYPDRIDLNFKICMTTNPSLERGNNGGGEPRGTPQ